MYKKIIKNIKGILVIWYRDLIHIKRDSVRILVSLLEPFFLLIILGTGFSSSINNLGQGEVNFIQFMFAGVIGMTILFSCVHSGVSIIGDREFGVLKEVLVAPVSRISIVFGKIAGGSTLAIIKGLMLLILSPVINVKLGVIQVLLFVGLMLLFSITITSMGILFAARQKSMEGFQILMNFIITPMLLLSGAFFPLNNVPSWMKVLAYINPAFYGIDSFRRILLQNTVSAEILNTVYICPLPVNVLALAGISIIFIVASLLLISKRE